MAAAERKEIVNVPLKDLYGVIIDYTSYPEFVSGMKSARLEGQQGDVRRIHFDLDLMKRVQYTVNLRDEFNEAAGTASISWTLAESAFFKTNNGGWTLKALGPEKTEVTYKLELDFSFPVPGLILKGLVAKTLPDTIAQFTKRAQHKRGAR